MLKTSKNNVGVAETNSNGYPQELMLDDSIMQKIESLAKNANTMAFISNMIGSLKNEDLRNDIMEKSFDSPMADMLWSQKSVENKKILMDSMKNALLDAAKHVNVEPIDFIAGVKLKITGKNK